MWKLTNREPLSISDINDIFIKAIRFYNSCSINEQEELISLMKESSIFLCDHNNDEDVVYVERYEGMYKDIPILREYFSASKRFCRFFHTQSYDKCIQNVGLAVFNEFVNRLNLKGSPDIIIESLYLTAEERIHRANENIHSKEFLSYDGLLCVLKTLEAGKGNKDLSLYVWDLLIKAFRCDSTFFKCNESHYFYYKDRTQYWTYNSLIKELRTCRWLYIGDELRCIKEDAYREELLENGYTFDADLLAKLEISSIPNIQEAKMISEMSPDTREIYALGKELRGLGYTSIDEIKQMKERLSELERQEEAIVIQEKKGKALLRKQQNEAQKEFPKRAKSKGIKGSDFETPDNLKAKSVRGDSPLGKNKSIDEILCGFEEKAKVQKEELEKVANLRDRIEQSQKYSYDWITALMELEVQSQGATGVSGNKALYISFDTLSFNPKNESMLILSDPSRYIPSSLEDMDSILVTFVLKNGTVEKIRFDSASVKDDNLILKCSKGESKLIEIIRKNVDKFQHAYIEVTEPIDILKYWQSRINGLGLEPNFSLKQNLRTDIEFIFGPPGTGKTTTLAQKISNLINYTNGGIKILVLAPTNKACDVLTRKLYHECKNQEDSWIWRFVKTDDSYIEDEELVYNRESEILRQGKVCVVSTISRYAFDGFEDGDLRTLDWDYVFIDEASMIPLYEVILPIYNPHSRHIIISGDPFQIEPIVNIDLWKTENIYTMVNLNEFVNPKTEPCQFKITQLMTQYRSIPKIGELFSGYLYGSRLLHNRSAADHRILKMGFKENPLNVISFPVGKDSIFELKRLSKSNIHIYSVIFAVEFLKYMTCNLSMNHAGEEIRIGVISPYSAEIQAIQKIILRALLFLKALMWFLVQRMAFKEINVIL
ncbi:MAG: AAA family ATPase, partial [Paramuribaculum sp.]|nr:AAA family ATPase [Paramuribaculum sp.]